jgi:uncharacterized repeat protein (TIGR03803 family)
MSAGSVHQCGNLLRIVIGKFRSSNQCCKQRINTREDRPLDRYVAKADNYRLARKRKMSLKRNSGGGFLAVFCALAGALLYITATLPVQAQAYTDLYNFDGTHGASPTYPQILAQGRDGNLYGTTPEGGTEQCGAQNCGVVFKITPSGTLTVLYNFNSAQGPDSYSGLTLGSDGNFYGTVGLSFGKVFKISPAGILTILYTNNGNEFVSPPIEGWDGNFYGVTNYPGNGYKITRSGQFTLLGSLSGGSLAPLLQASDGNFYGTDSVGGTGGAGSVFRMTPAGVLADFYDFASVHLAYPNAPLIQAGDGNLYGTTTAGGSSNAGVIFRLTPSGSLTVVHNFEANSALDAGLVQANDGNFYYPVGPAEEALDTATTYGEFLKIDPNGGYSVLYDFAFSGGIQPWATPMQHTNGKFYGLMNAGETDNLGVVYSFDAGLPPFVELLPSGGRVGKVIDILGQGFSGATSVTFNGTVAAFKVESDTYLTAIVPTGATSGAVTVITSTGVLNSNQAFRVVP